MPYFVFSNGKGLQFRVQAPMCSVGSEVERWGSGNSNIFIFLLIERGSRIVQSISAIGVPTDFRRRLVALWSSGTHLSDLDPNRRPELLKQILGQQNTESVDSVWLYNSETEEFKRASKQPSSTEAESVYESRQIELSIGERIQFTVTYKRLGVFAYDIGEITHLDTRGNATVLLERGNREVRFNLKDHPHIDYAYAVGSLGARTQSMETLVLDEDNTKPYRQTLVNDYFEPYGYVPLMRSPHVAGAR